MFRESETLELKKSVSELKEAIVSISAILNKSGRGELYFGVKNDGAVVGQAVSGRTLRDISQAIAAHVEPKTYPKIEKVVLDGKECVRIAFSGDDAPYFAFGRAYVRVADEDRQLSAKGLEKMILRRTAAKWDSRLSEHSVDEIDEKTIREFIQKANLSQRIKFQYTTKKAVLEKLGLAKDSKITNAAVLLFSKNEPIEVQAAVFAGIDKTTFLDIKQFKGNIFQLLKQSEAYVKEHMNWKARLVERTRQEIPEIPLRAITEALVNSFCHRDYQAPEGNKIAVFKDRIEVWNPGDFPEGYTPQDFISHDLPSILRNPRIANALYLSSDIEKWGSGLKRIYEECKANGVAVEFKLMKYGFAVQFARPKGVPVNVPVNVPERLASILKLVSENDRVSALELSKRLHVAEKTVKRDLQKLKESGRLKRVGPDKSGRWILVEKAEDDKK